MDYRTALDTVAAKQAHEALNKRFDFSRKKASDVWEAVKSMVIVDHDVVVDDMLFQHQEGQGTTPLYRVSIGSSEHEFRVHIHALRQMATEVGIPSSFVNLLTHAAGSWERRELTDLLNERFKLSEFRQRSFRTRASFVNRVVGDEVRGFVSPSFKLHLSTPHMLVAFAGATYTLGAMPVDATGSDLSFTYHTVLPYVFEPRAGEFIAIGCSFSNSDFGAGSLQIRLNVTRVGTWSTLLGKVIMSKTHGGAARKGEDEGSYTVKQDTMEALILGAQKDLRDAVSSALSPDSVNGLLMAVTRAMEKEISWPKLQSYFSGHLTQAEIAEIEALIERKKVSRTLPPLQFTEDGAAIIDLWFAGSAVAELASTVTDADRKVDLMELAGGLLTK